MCESLPANSIVLTMIPLSEIEKNFADNPRLSTNEMRLELKSSISSSKAEYLILEVSQKPGDTGYCLLRGGNTRLEVTHELHDEWDDVDGPSPYAAIKCIVYPWRNDAEKAIMNATENLVRGKLSYAEEARAVSILKQQYRDGGITEISFPEWAKSLGLSMSLSSSSIGRYLQTADVLNPALPKLMIEGRANTSVVNWLLSVRSALTRVLKERIQQERALDPEDISREENKRLNLESAAAADQILALVNRQRDDFTLDKKAYSNNVVKEFEQRHGAMTEAERLAVGRKDIKKLSVFAEMYGIEDSDMFGHDDRINAAIIVHDILNRGGYEASNRKTRQLKRMNIDSDVRFHSIGRHAGQQR